LNTPFNIVMSHTDMNGCVSEVAEQYMVYDGTFSIPVIPHSQCLVNTHFPQGLADPMESDTLAHNAKAGFRLQQLYASISPNAEPDQLISGPVWQSLIGQIPKVVPGAPSGYNDYRWDYSIVLNA